MSNRAKRRNSISGQFAARLIEMIESPAFRVLSLSARRVLDRVEIELAHHGGNDNGQLPVTYDNFEAYGIHRHAVGPAIRETVALGFLEVTESGRAGNAEFRRPNLFRLTYRPAKHVLGDGTRDNGAGNRDRKEGAAEQRHGQNSSPEKAKIQWPKTPHFGSGNHHRK